MVTGNFYKMEFQHIDKGGNRRYWTFKNLFALRQDYMSGMLKEDMERKYNKKFHNLCIIANRYGMKRKYIDASVKENLKNDYLGGANISVLSKKYNGNPKSIETRLRRAGVWEKRFNDALINKGVDLYNSGLSSEEVALKLQCSSTAVKDWLKRNGVKARDCGTTGKKLVFKDKEKWLRNRIGINKKTEGWVTELRERIRSLPKYFSWRRDVFQRDKWTCVFCGARNRAGERHIIHADHIYAFSKIIADFNLKTIEESIVCEKLWDISNGRTLCWDCHKKTDTYGAKIKKIK